MARQWTYVVWSIGERFGLLLRAHLECVNDSVLCGSHQLDWKLVVKIHFVIECRFFCNPYFSAMCKYVLYKLNIQLLIRIVQWFKLLLLICFRYLNIVGHVESEILSFVLLDLT